MHWAAFYVSSLSSSKLAHRCLYFVQEVRMRTGSKKIYHLEAWVIKVMSLYKVRSSIIGCDLILIVSGVAFLLQHRHVGLRLIAVNPILALVLAQRRRFWVPSACHHGYECYYTLISYAVCNTTSIYQCFFFVRSSLLGPCEDSSFGRFQQGFPLGS